MTLTKTLPPNPNPTSNPTKTLRLTLPNPNGIANPSLEYKKRAKRVAMLLLWMLDYAMC